MGGAKKGRRGRVEDVAAAQQSYLRMMIPMLSGYSRAVAAFGALVQSPRWDDEAWRRELEQQAAALHALFDELAGVKGVPKDLEETHGAILGASRSLEQAFTRLAAAGDQGPGDWPALMDLLGDAGEGLCKSADVMSANLARLE